MSTKDIAARLGGRRKIYPIETDEGTLYVRGLNGVERREYFTAFDSREDRLISDQRLIAKTLCNQDGTPAFEPDEQDAALQAVLQWDIQTSVKPVVAKILEASGLSVTAPETASKN